MYELIKKRGFRHTPEASASLFPAGASALHGGLLEALSWALGRNQGAACRCAAQGRLDGARAAPHSARPLPELRARPPDMPHCQRESGRAVRAASGRAVRRSHVSASELARCPEMGVAGWHVGSALDNVDGAVTPQDRRSLAL